jgi:predicted Zn-dependent protease
MSPFNLGGLGYGTGGRRGGGGMRWGIAAVILVIGLVGYFMKEKVTNPETGETYRRAMNVDQQKALGLQAAKQMIPQMGGAVDPRTSPDAALVAEVGARLVRNSNAAKSAFADNFHFFLVNDPRTINAFALPGGQVSITRGLYERLENEAQLAGVLGHEIGHVIAEHSAQQMAKGQLGQMIATAVGVGSDSHGGAMAAQMANQMLQLKYGRDDERQSDSIGLKYMVQAGYHPKGMLGVMRILKEAAGGGRQPEFMASHPHPEERLATIQEFLERNKDQLAKMDLTEGRPLKGTTRLQGGTPREDPNRLPGERW